MRGHGSFQPSEIRKGIKLVGLNISNRMKRNEQMAAKQETLGTFYCMPGLFFGTHLSHAHNSCSPGLAARGSHSHRHSEHVPPWSQRFPSLGTGRSGGIPFSSPSWLLIRPAVHTRTQGKGWVLLIISVQSAQLLNLNTVGSTWAQSAALAPTATLVSLTLSHGKATSIPCRRLFPLLRNCSILGDLGGSRVCFSCFLAHLFLPSMQRWSMWDEMC